MKAFVFPSVDCIAFISQGRQPCVFKLDISHNFLAMRRALNVPKRLLSFPWPARKRKGKGFSGARGDGRGTLFLSPSHARARAPKSFALPSRRPAAQNIFFLDGLRCRCQLRLCFVPRYRYRTIRNKSNPPYSFLP